MFNKVQLVTFPHVILAAYLTAGLFMVAVSGWLYASQRHAEDRELHRKAIRIGAVVALVAGLGVAVSGDFQGKVMTEVQPMKMAAAEGLYETQESCAPFSVLTIGSLDGREEKKAFTVPCLLSFLGTGSTDGRVEGINDLRAEYAETYGSDPGAAYYSVDDYVPVIPVTYWSFRLMIGLGMGAAIGRGAGAVADPARPGAHVAVVPGALRRAAAGGAGRQLLRLDLHRDGPAAVGGVRADDHRPRGLAGRLGDRGDDLAGRPHRAVRRAGGHRGRADPAHRPERAPRRTSSRRTR